MGLQIAHRGSNPSWSLRAHRHMMAARRTDVSSLAQIFGGSMKRSHLLVLSTVAAVGWLAPPALADNVNVDGDNVVPVAARNPLDLGTVCEGAPATADVLIAITRNPGAFFGDGAEVTIDFTP